MMMRILNAIIFLNSSFCFLTLRIYATEGIIIIVIIIIIIIPVSAVEDQSHQSEAGIQSAEN